MQVDLIWPAKGKHLFNGVINIGAPKIIDFDQELSNLQSIDQIKEHLIYVDAPKLFTMEQCKYCGAYTDPAFNIGGYLFVPNFYLQLSSADLTDHIRRTTAWLKVAEDRLIQIIASQKDVVSRLKSGSFPDQSCKYHKHYGTKIINNYDVSRYETSSDFVYVLFDNEIRIHDNKLSPIRRIKVTEGNYEI